MKDGTPKYVILRDPKKGGLVRIDTVLFSPDGRKNLRKLRMQKLLSSPLLMAGWGGGLTLSLLFDLMTHPGIIVALCFAVGGIYTTYQWRSAVRSCHTLVLDDYEMEE